MLAKKYNSLVTELSSFILKHNELETIKVNAEFDLKWRLTQLYEEVAEEDEQKFIDLAGMQGHLTTTAQKKEIAKREKKSSQQAHDSHSGMSELIETDKKTTDKSWA